MNERFPVASCGTVATLPASSVAAFDADGREGDTGPALGAPVRQPQARARIEPPDVVDHRLADHVAVAGRRELRVELRGRDLFGLDPGRLGHLTLRHAHGVVHKPRGVDLHGHGVRVGRVDAVEIQHFLEIEIHALNASAGGVEQHGFLGRQAREFQDVGQQLVAGPALAPPDIAQRLDRRRDARAGPDQPVLQTAARMAAFPQTLEPVQSHHPVAAEQPPAALSLHGREEVYRTVQTVADQQRVPRQSGEGRLGARHLAGRRVGREVQGLAQPPPEVVQGQECPGQDHGALVPQQLQPSGDGRQPRAVDDQDCGKARLHRGQRLGIAGGHLDKQPRREALEDLGEEGRPQIPAALEEGLGGGLDAGKEGFPVGHGVGQGLAQRLGRPQDHGRPELYQRVERPHSLPFRDPNAPKGRLAQGGGDVALQQIQHADQVDPRRARRRRLAHSTSIGWGSYGSLYPRSCGLPAFYLSGDVV